METNEILTFFFCVWPTELKLLPWLLECLHTYLICQNKLENVNVNDLMFSSSNVNDLHVLQM